jgi:hypothetical protein
MRVKVEQVEQVADGRHVARDIGLVAAGVLNGIGQVVAAAVAERSAEQPVPFDELHERGMLAIDVADMAAGGEGRNGDHGNARAGAEEVHRLDEARVIEAAALVHGDEDGRLLPLLGVALRELDDVLREGLEEPPLRGSGVAVHDAVRLHVGDCPDERIFGPRNKLIV